MEVDRRQICGLSKAFLVLDPENTGNQRKLLETSRKLLIELIGPKEIGIKESSIARIIENEH